MTESLDLDAIRARCEVLLPAPWTVPDFNPVRVIMWDIHQGPFDPDWPYLFVNGRDAPATAAFIANARQDVPALLAEVERLRAMVASLIEEPSDA